MKLTKGQIITLIAAIITVVLTGVVRVLIREWYAPDIRYEEGSWYLSPNLALTSLKLTNLGHSDGEDIRITVTFNQTIRDVTSSDSGFPFTVSFGGKGQKSISGHLSRLVPGQILYLYFATAVPENSLSENTFVKSIIFNGGQGKIGKPIFFVSLFSFISGLVFSVLPLIILDKIMNSRLEQFYKKLDLSISFAMSMINKGASEEEFLQKWEEQFGKEKFRRNTLKRAAVHAFATMAKLKRPSQ